MSLTNDFPAFVKASWLADLPIDFFFDYSQAKIDLVMIIYNDLDRKFCKTVVDNHGDANFYARSFKLDERKRNA